MQIRRIFPPPQKITRRRRVLNPVITIDLQYFYRLRAVPWRRHIVTDRYQVLSPHLQKGPV